MAAEILQAVQANLQLSHLLVVLIGTVAGMVIGALPGLSAVSGVALLLPFTFAMEPAQGLIMLAAVYMSAEYGGSISAILINTPGTAGAACTVIEGTPGGALRLAPRRHRGRDVRRPGAAVPHAAACRHGAAAGAGRDVLGRRHGPCPGGEPVGAERHQRHRRRCDRHCAHARRPGHCDRQRALHL